jgi:hypothetical protein
VLSVVLHMQCHLIAVFALLCDLWVVHFNCQSCASWDACTLDSKKHELLTVFVQVSEAYVGLAIQAASDIKAWFEDPSKLKVGSSACIVVRHPGSRLLKSTVHVSSHRHNSISSVLGSASLHWLSWLRTTSLSKKRGLMVRGWSCALCQTACKDLPYRTFMTNPFCCSNVGLPKLIVIHRLRPDKWGLIQTGNANKLTLLCAVFIAGLFQHSHRLQQQP